MARRRAIVWDKQQRRVISADPRAKQIVIAGPGMGKTAVGCGRIAHLIDGCGVEPVNVLLISFTRTAVAEIRHRIATFIHDPARAAGVRIATLDSLTWSLRHGFDDNLATPPGDYEASIERLCELLRGRYPELLDHVDKYEHLVVDEAQDVLKIRAELIELIISDLASSCGVTILVDPCQSIYGFTRDNSGDEHDGGTALLDRLARPPLAGQFEKVELKTVYRTSRRGLLKLLKAARPLVFNLEPGAQTQESYENLRACIEENGRLVDAMPLDLPEILWNRDDVLVLYRTRAEALMTSSIFSQNAASHRLRLSGLPVWLQPWIGAVFHDYLQPRIDAATFQKRWDELRCGGLAGSPYCELAWERLLRIAGHAGSIRLDAVRSTLGRARPPTEFCIADGGTIGPIIGTIHASKGRESDTVYLFVPPFPEGDHVAWDEECRVLYVGATRARRALHVGMSSPSYARPLPRSGRPCRFRRSEGAAWFEVGREEDYDPCSIVSCSIHTPQTAKALQARLREEDAFAELTARAVEDGGFRYRLFPEGSENVADCCGELTAAFSEDVREIARVLDASPPASLPLIRQVGVRSIVLAPDSPRLPHITSPADRTGIFLAPVIRAWTHARFRKE